MGHGRSADAGRYAEVPDLRGLVVAAARAAGQEAGVVVTSSNLDGPPLAALTWPGRWIVVEQTPRAGAIISRGETVAIQFVERGGPDAGVREPRRPLPDPDSMSAYREFDDPGDA